MIELPNDQQGIWLPKDLADALYNCLLRPQTDNNGQPMYPISVNMALELRRAIKK